MADIEISVDSGTSKRLLTAGKYCDRNINVTAIGGAAEPVIEPLEVTANGTYTAPAGVDGYNPVTVNVSSGGGNENVLDSILSTSGTLTITGWSDFPTNWYFVYSNGSFEVAQSAVDILTSRENVSFVVGGADDRMISINITGEFEQIAKDEKNIILNIKGDCQIELASGPILPIDISDTEALKIITGGATE